MYRSSQEGVTWLPKNLPRTRSQTDGRRLSLCKVWQAFSGHVSCKVVWGRRTFTCFKTDCCQILLDILEGMRLGFWFFCISCSYMLELNDTRLGAFAGMLSEDEMPQVKKLYKDYLSHWNMNLDSFIVRWEQKGNSSSSPFKKNLSTFLWSHPVCN